MENMGWPQVIYLALLLCGVLNAILHHGETETKKYNAWISLTSAVLTIGLVYWGGFFG